MITNNRAVPDMGETGAANTLSKAPANLLFNNGQLEKRAAIRLEVMNALSENRVTVAYQPIASASNSRRIAFHETLLRIVDQSGTLVPAVEFISLVQETSLGRKLDCLALRRALQALKADTLLRLSVNISAMTSSCDEWLEILRSADRSVPGIGYRLVVEVTEQTALENTDATHHFMEKVRGFGCSFALDDFGAGATAFRHFRDFRFDMVKIDGCFIRELASNPDHKVLVSSLTAIARHFEMLTVAEFVETDDQAVAAALLGVDCIQGYLIGKPELAWRRNSQFDQMAG